MTDSQNTETTPIRSDEEIIADTAEQMGLTKECVTDMVYLRTRQRWTPELEAELIRLHQAGTPPNMMEFGVTEETQQNLLDEAMKVISAKYQNDPIKQTIVGLIEDVENTNLEILGNISKLGSLLCLSSAGMLTKADYVLPDDVEFVIGLIDKYHNVSRRLVEIQESLKGRMNQTADTAE